MHINMYEHCAQAEKKKVDNLLVFLQDHNGHLGRVGERHVATNVATDNAQHVAKVQRMYWL